MKIAILTAYTDTNKWSVDGKCDYITTSSKNHMQYSYKHNYSYICDLYNENDYYGFHPTWIKMFSVKKHLSNYDYIVWVDGDCVFTDMNIPVQSFINDSVSVILPKCEKDPVSNMVWTGITTGFMVIKNTEFSHKFLDTIIEKSENYKYDYFHEQTVVDNYLREAGYYKNIPSLKDKLEDDLDLIVYESEFGFLPYKYHKYSKSDQCLYMYHAGGNTLTKNDRLKLVLTSKSNETHDIKFGIYTSFYNSEEFVDNAFNQIESLNYDNFEWHIVDDFSTDRTHQFIIDRLKKSPISHKIRLYNQTEKKDMYWFPNLFFNSTFEWIVLMDVDDEVHPNFLNVYNNIIKSSPDDITLLSSDFRKINYETKSLHSISYILNDEVMSEKIKRYHPKCDYLNNVSYSCFGTLRAFKNLPEIKFEITDRLAGAEDSYHVFWVNSYGKYLHIPRPLYKWNMHTKSESHSTNILSNFNGNFDIALNRLNNSDFGIDTKFNDIYVETSALGYYDFNNLKDKRISLWTRNLTLLQTQNLTNLYYDCNLVFNDILADTHIICSNYFSEKDLNSILEKVCKKSILVYYQNNKKYETTLDLDLDMDMISNTLTSQFRNTIDGSFSWWKYIRHFIITKE